VLIISETKLRLINYFYSCKELPKPITVRDCSKDCKSKICVLSDWSDWSECPQDSCINGSIIIISYTPYIIIIIPYNSDQNKLY
jgi:hypothetical protein